MEQSHDHDHDPFEAQSHLYKHILSFITSMSLKCAIELNIPDAIHTHGQPITLSQLISSLKIHPSKTNHLKRLMRLLVHFQIFSQNKQDQAYVLTPISSLLLKDQASSSLLPYALLNLDPALMTPWNFFSEWFHGNDDQYLTPFETAHKMSLWDYGNRNPTLNDSFNAAMACESRMFGLVLEDCKKVFEGVGSLVDVGGGTGGVAKVVSEAFPHIKCSVLDLPHVVENLHETENLKFVGGDMFEYVPPADAVLMKCVLHDWTDEECVKILKKCKEAIIMSKEIKGIGKVIILEMVINDDEIKKEEHHMTETKLFYDMMMMALLNGRERNEKEWEKLFLEAGFSHYNITPIFGMRSLIEVFP